MKPSVVWLALLAVLVLSLSLFGQAVMPRLTAVEPASAKAGDQMTVSGENLDKPNVAELRLTDGKTDIKLTVIEQTATAIKFRIPANCKPGRYALLTVTKRGQRDLEIEQPVKATVEGTT